MPDYAACVNHDCPLAKNCCRYLMEFSDVQSVSCFEYDEGRCDGYWPTESGAPFRLRDKPKEQE